MDTQDVGRLLASEIQFFNHPVYYLSLFKALQPLYLEENILI